MMTTITKMPMSQIDANLLASFDGDDPAVDGWELFEHWPPAIRAAASNPHYQIIFHVDHGRAGVVFRGSGSSGAVSWTYAESPDEALQLYLDDDMRP